MVLPGRHDRGGRDADPVARADAWFLANGLSYFVPECRREAREALSPRRTVPRLLLVALVAAGAGVALAWGTGQVSAAPAVVLTLVLLAVGSYALTVLHVRPILAWALRRTASSLPSLLPQMTRALPLLLIFVTFLFINAEVWQLAASLQTGTLWLVVLLFVGMAVAFLLVRLPEEVDRADDAVDEDFLRRACRRTPLEEACEELLADPGADPVARATSWRAEAWSCPAVTTEAAATATRSRPPMRGSSPTGCPTSCRSGGARRARHSPLGAPSHGCCWSRWSLRAPGWPWRG